MAVQGVVSVIEGTVKAISADGTERILKSGDLVLPEERIQTDANSSIGISFDDGSFITLGHNTNELISELLESGNDLLETSQALADSEEDLLSELEDRRDAIQQEVDEIQQALLEGADPSVDLEAPAAGAPGTGDGTVSEGSNEGSSTVIIEYEGDQVDPDAGYSTIC